MNILIFNWRDIKNPIAGGAEVLTHEVARRWVAQGHQVTLVTSRFPSSLAQETLDGVEIIRRGNSWTVYWHAYRVYREQFHGRCDLVIDEVNTIPFFTPWYAREPILMHFNQMAREVWLYECWWPLGLVGYLCEPWWLKLYRQVPAVAISRSSRHDLLRLGFDQHHVDVIPLPTKPYRPGHHNGRESDPTLLFVGRLKRSKRVDHAIHALVRIRRQWPTAKLWIVGDGDAHYRHALVNLVKRLRLTYAVTFFGQVSETEKQRCMQRAHAILVPSVREGWGLIVSEAHSLGTPAIVYPVPGLVDSTEHQITGLVCDRANPSALATQVAELLQNRALGARLAHPSHPTLPPATWDDTAAHYLDIVQRRTGQLLTPAMFDRVSILIHGSSWDGQTRSSLEEVARVSSRLGQSCDIVIVGRPGGTAMAQLLERLEVPASRIRTVPYDPFLGEAYALITGFRETSGELVLYLHPNLDIPPGQLSRLLDAWRRRPADVVVASRRHDRSWRRPWVWRSLSNAYHGFVRWLFGVDMGDVQTSIKLFRRSALERVLPRLVIKEYAFDAEVLAVAHRLGYTIAIEPIRLHQQVPQRRAQLLDMFHLLMDTLAIWYRYRWLKYYDRPLVLPIRTPTVSIVIPCKHPSPYLTDCLAACLAQDYPSESVQIIVLPDEPCHLVNARVHVVPTGPVGPGKKRDLALAHCTGEIVAFIDDDTVPRRDWMRNAVRWFEDERVAAVGGPAPTPATDSLRQVASGQVYSSWLVGGTQNYRYYPAPGRWVDDYPSCNLFIRRSVLQEVGGFDTTFWPGEDTVLCSKITHKLGKKIWYDPDAVVYHHRRPLFRDHLRQIGRYAEHRGCFAKRYPSTSLRLRYFLPTCLVGFLLGGGIMAVVWPAWRLTYVVVIGAYVGAAMLWGMLSLNLRLAGFVFLGIVASHLIYGVFFLKGLLSKALPEEARA